MAIISYVEVSAVNNSRYGVAHAFTIETDDYRTFYMYAYFRNNCRYYQHNVRYQLLVNGVNVYPYSGYSEPYFDVWGSCEGTTIGSHSYSMRMPIGIASSSFANAKEWKDKWGYSISGTCTLQAVITSQINSGFDYPPASGTYYTNAVTINVGTPTVALSISDVTRNSAKLTGSANWNGGSGYGSAGSYNLSCSNSTVSYSTNEQTISNLTANTSYTAIFTATNNYGKSASSSKSFSTLHNAPSISNVVVTSQRNSATLSRSVSYDNALFASHSLQYWKVETDKKTLSSEENTSFNISSLEPNTLYHYVLTENDNGKNNTKTSTYSGTFKTKANLPILNFTSAAINSHTGVFSLDGTTCDTNTELVISSCYIKYKKATETIWNTTIFNQDKTITLDNLIPNSEYDLHLSVKDSADNIIEKDYTFKIIGNVRKGYSFINKIMKANKEITEIKYQNHTIKCNKMQLIEKTNTIASI